MTRDTCEMHSGSKQSVTSMAGVDSLVNPRPRVREPESQIYRGLQKPLQDLDELETPSQARLCSALSRW